MPAIVPPGGAPGPNAPGGPNLPRSFHNALQNPPDFGLNPSSGGSGSSGSAAGGGSDWQHLLIRGAEFIVGGALIVVGVQAMIRNTKPAQTVIQTTGAVAKAAAK